jgi:hypothetical protein
MPDDKKKPGGQDRTRINVNEDYELRDWSKKVGVSPDELKQMSARWDLQLRRLKASRSLASMELPEGLISEYRPVRVAGPRQASSIERLRGGLRY